MQKIDLRIGIRRRNGEAVRNWNCYGKRKIKMKMVVF